MQILCIVHDALFAAVLGSCQSDVGVQDTGVNAVIMA